MSHSRFSQPTKVPLWLRIALPAILILVWLSLGGVGGPTFGKLSGVSTNDQASFLPASADSTKVDALQGHFLSSTAIPAIIVMQSSGVIAPSSFPIYAGIGARLGEVSGTGAVVGPIPSKDGRAIEYIVPVAGISDLKTAVADLRVAASTNLPSGVTSYVTGPAGLSADLVSAFGGIDGILLLVAVAAVFFILLIVYRSLVLPFVVLLTSMVALCGAIIVVYELALHGVIKLNGQSQGILSILVIGAATDYSLLFISRYREFLLKTESRFDAVWGAFKVAIEPIAASAATVVLALLCLLFSDLNSNKSLGPIAAIGIVFAFLSAVSFLPATLAVFGRVAFWPFRPLYAPREEVAHGSHVSLGLEGLSALWRAVGSLIAARARVVWAVCLVALLLLAAGLFQLKASGVPQTDLILSKSTAVDGQKVLAAHFDAGSGDPIVVIADQAKAAEVLAATQSTAGVTSASLLSGSAGPVVKDGQVLVEAVSVYDSSSGQAESLVKSLRGNLAGLDAHALVGGTAAISLDTNQTSQDDLVKIIPIVLAVILVVLMLLLRSVLAPVLLIASVVVSFAASLGASALMFSHFFHFPGADPSVPLFGFVFLVALGVDYNIFLMTRVREESLKLGTRAGILRGLGETGSVITSAGVVLAATFAALGVIPILFLAQIAFIVAFGVLLDTIVVRSLLVPALSYDLGKRIWWPSVLGRPGAK